ncbi:MAG: DNA polymerase II, partial [Pseudomonadales bacterium]
MRTLGFVLSSEQRDTLQGIELRYWLVSSGAPQCCVVEAQESVFFVLAQERAEVAFALRGERDWRLASLALKDPRQREVMGLYCSSIRQFRRVIDLLTRAGLTMLEEDIRPAQRYLMERFIKGPVSYDPSAKAQLVPARFNPTFSLLSLDIETDMHTGAIFCIGVVGADGFQRVLMCGEGVDTDCVHYCADERQLLEAYVVLIQQVDPDILIGWNVIGFDFAVIAQRASLYGVALAIGRDGSHSVVHRSARGKSYMRIAGRIVLDGIDVLKGATYQFQSFSLEYVARALLGRGKLVDNVAHRAQEIIDMFHEDKAALAKYNLMDCQLVLDIFEHAHLIDYLVQRAELTGLALDKLGGWSTAFDNLYLPQLHRRGYVAPQYASGVSDMASPGGYVMDSRPGLYRHVLVLDFKSLYPSIIRTFKIDPLGLAQAALEPEADHVPGYNGARFSRSDHLLPGIIGDLWLARDAAKRESNSAMSQAIKILMSSMYGVLGSDACRFFDHRLSGSITLRGHHILTATAQKIEREYGYKVIYGDTDSVFVWLGDDCGNANAHSIGTALAQALTKWWRESLVEDYQLESFLELEYETHYCKFLMPTMRDSDQGSKKRYAGLQHFVDGRTQMVFKGMENVRSDWTDLAKEVQQEVFSCVFEERPFEAYLREVIAQVRAGELDAKLLYRKKLRQSVESYQKNRPPHAQAALKLQQYYEREQLRVEVSAGQIIEYYMTAHGPQPSVCLQSPLDYEHYIERQLKP